MAYNDDRKRRLQVWLDDDAPPTVESEAAALPQPWGVLYARPNPDQTRKNCRNCMMYVISMQCAIHSAEIVINPEAICGYHVFGQPMTHMPMHPNIDPVDPELSGLETVPGGTSCDTCRYYRPQSPVAGMCIAVEESNGVPAMVEALGCCARWEGG